MSSSRNVISGASRPTEREAGAHQQGRRNVDAQPLWTNSAFHSNSSWRRALCTGTFLNSHFLFLFISFWEKKRECEEQVSETPNWPPSRLGIFLAQVQALSCLCGYGLNLGIYQQKCCADASLGDSEPPRPAQIGGRILPK